MHDEGYVIVPQPHELAVIADTGTGLFYGAQTVKQLIIGNGHAGNGADAYLETATIRDWPALPHRGLDDDLSRGPVPTLEFQERQVRILAAYKLNIYSPYFEQSLTYSGSPLIAPPGGAMSPADVATLIHYAAQYHITVVPEQEAFGHLHHVLKYEQYSSLAETPHGQVLSPIQPGSLALIKQWFTQITQQFPSPWVHIGADETVELGKGQTKDLVTQRGLDQVYVDFLRQIDGVIRPTGKRVLFWGDLAWHNPDLVAALPKDMIGVPWVYDALPDFDKYIRPFNRAGMEVWVAPGVNNWRRVYPDNNVALVNIQHFVRDGQRMGARGMLNTVWNDDGEGIFDEDWYGVLFGAAASWQPGESPAAAVRDPATAPSSTATSAAKLTRRKARSWPRKSCFPTMASASARRIRSSGKIPGAPPASRTRPSCFPSSKTCGSTPRTPSPSSMRRARPIRSGSRMRSTPSR